MSEFPLDRLRVPEDKVSKPAVIPVSVFVSRTIWSKPLEDVSDTLEKIERKLLEEHPLREKESLSPCKEGIINLRKRSNNVLEGFYVKEAPTKLTFIGEYEEPILETGYFKTVRAENRVKFKIEIYPNECKLILFGGSEPLMSKTLFSINSTFRKFIDGNHKTFSPYLSREDMFKVLSSFGFDVEYIYIDPGESKKLRKYVEKKRGKELKIEMVYDVHTQYRGYRITASPVVQQMIKESGIQIREIQAKISYGVTRITVRVNSSGRLVFFIPGNLPSDEDELYEIASEIYRQIMDEKLKTTPPLTLDSYIGEIE